MTIEISIHECVATNVEPGESNGSRWTDYTFTDAKGQKFVVTVYHHTARDALKGKLLEFVRDRESA